MSSTPRLEVASLREEHEKLKDITSLLNTKSKKIMSAPDLCGHIADKVIDFFIRLTAMSNSNNPAFSWKYFCPTQQSDEDVAKRDARDSFIEAYVRSRGSQIYSLLQQAKLEILLPNGVGLDTGRKTLEDVKAIMTQHKARSHACNYPNGIKDAEIAWVRNIEKIEVGLANPEFLLKEMLIPPSKASMGDVSLMKGPKAKR